MQSQPEKRPGEYRSVTVVIGNIRTPPPLVVPNLMRNFLSAVDLFVCQGIYDESQIWNTHNKFEAIHPFMDGNGRVGRIWMNIMRLRIGLKWLTIRAEERQEYYRRINEFRQQNPYYCQFLSVPTEENIETICEESNAASTT